MSMRVGINIEEWSVLHTSLNFLRTLSCFPLWSLMHSFPLRSLLQTRTAYPLLPSAIVTIRLYINGRQQRELRKQKTRGRNPMNKKVLIQLPISTWGLNAIFLPFFNYSFRNRRILHWKHQWNTPINHILKQTTAITKTQHFFVKYNKRMASDSLKNFEKSNGHVKFKFLQKTYTHLIISYQERPVHKKIQDHLIFLEY